MGRHATRRAADRQTVPIAQPAFRCLVRMLGWRSMTFRLRQFLLVLIAFAFLGGTSFQLARSAEHAAPMVMAGMPCDMMMSHAGMHDDKPRPPSNGSPCKGMTSDCIKMCCVTDAALSARMVHLDIALNFSHVDYWSAWTKLADFVREPEPLPPRTA